jgi:hypothetical protein
MKTIRLLLFLGVHLGFILGLGAGASGCGEQATQRQDQIKQDNADTQAKYADLQPADGTYTGLVHLISTDEDFAVTLDIQRVYEPEQSQNSQDPSETVSIPKLSGQMTFTALKNLSLADYSHFGPLLDPMGGFSIATFDYGDFNPTNNQLILPYSVAGATGTYGELTGTLAPDPQTGIYHYSGSWFSKPFGTVGTFELDVAPRGSQP